MAANTCRPLLNMALGTARVLLDAGEFVNEQLDRAVPGFESGLADGAHDGARGGWIAEVAASYDERVGRESGGVPAAWQPSSAGASSSCAERQFGLLRISSDPFLPPSRVLFSGVSVAANLLRVDSFGADSTAGSYGGSYGGGLLRKGPIRGAFERRSSASASTSALGDGAAGSRDGAVGSRDEAVGSRDGAVGSCGTCGHSAYTPYGDLRELAGLLAQGSSAAEDDGPRGPRDASFDYREMT